MTVPKNFIILTIICKQENVSYRDLEIRIVSIKKLSLSQKSYTIYHIVYYLFLCCNITAKVLDQIIPINLPYY